MRRVLKPVQDSLAGVSLPSATTETQSKGAPVHVHASAACSTGVRTNGGGRAAVISDATPSRGGILAAASGAAPMPPTAPAPGAPVAPPAATTGGDSLQNLAVGRAPNETAYEADGNDTLLVLATGLSVRDSDKFRLGGVTGMRQGRRRGNKKEPQNVTRRDANAENLAPALVQVHSARQPTAATFTSLMAAEVTNSATAGGVEGPGIANIPPPPPAAAADSSSTNGNAGADKVQKRGSLMRRGMRRRGRLTRTRQSGGGGALGALGMAVPAAIAVGRGGDDGNKDKKVAKNVKKKGNSNRYIVGALVAELGSPAAPPATMQPSVVTEEAPSLSVLATLDLSMMSLNRSQEVGEEPPKSKNVEDSNAGGGVLSQTGARAVAAKEVSPSPAVSILAENAAVESSHPQPIGDGEAMDIDQVDHGIATNSLVMARQKPLKASDQNVPPSPLRPEGGAMKSPKASKKVLNSKRQRKQSFSPPALQIRKVFSTAAAKASAATPSSTFANWGSPSPRPKPSKRMDKKKTPVSKLDGDFMAEESPRNTASISPNPPVPMSPIVKAPAPVDSVLVKEKTPFVTAPIANTNAGGNKIAGSKVLAVSPARYNSSQFEANAIATRLFEDVKDTAIRNVLARSNGIVQTSAGVSGIVHHSAEGRSKGSSGSVVTDVQEGGRISAKMIHVAGNEELCGVEGGGDDENSSQHIQKRGKAKKMSDVNTTKPKYRGEKESKRENSSSEGPIAAAVAAATALGSATNQRPRRQARKVNRLSVSWNDTTYSEKSNRSPYDGCSDDEDGDDAFAAYEHMCKVQKEKDNQSSPSPSPKKEKSKQRRGSLKKSIKSASSKRKGKKKSSAKAESKENNNADSKEQLSPGSSWSSEQVEALRRAYHAVEPTSFSFWEDVAFGLDGDKTADQCRDKWFSLVQTPKIRAKKKRNSNGGGQRSGRKTPSALRRDVDDLFQSTPYRRVNVNIDEDGDDSNYSCNESEVFIADDDVMLPCEFSSPISHSPSKLVNLAAEADGDGDRDTGHDISPVYFRTGYKGYIKGLAKIRRRNGGKRHGSGGVGSSVGANATLTPAIKDKSGRNVSAKIGAGDVQMNGVLTPGGTVQVRAPTDSDLEDLVIRPGEEYSDDEESIAKENAELEA